MSERRVHALRVFLYSDKMRRFKGNYHFKLSVSEKIWENRDYKRPPSNVSTLATIFNTSKVQVIHERFIYERKETRCLLRLEKSWIQYFYFYAVHDLPFWVVWISSYLPISNCTVYPLFLSSNDLELREPAVFQLAWSSSFFRFLFSRASFALILIGDCFFPSHCTLTIPQCTGPTKWGKHHFSKM